MTNPDILLERDRISVVGGSGPEETNGTERGDLEITASKGDPASIRLNADRANLTLGGGSGSAPQGGLRLRDTNENLRVKVSAEETTGIDIRDPTGDSQARLNTIGLMLSEFTGGEPGTVQLQPTISPDTRDTIRVYGNTATADIGNNFQSGTLNLYRSGSRDSPDGFFHRTVAADAENARVRLGGSERDGTLTLTDSDDNDRVQVDAAGGELIISDATQQSQVGSPEILLLSEFATGEALAAVGSANRSGEIWLRKPEQNSDQAPVVMDLQAQNDAGNPQAVVGGEGTDGVVTARNGNDTTTAELQGGDGNVVAGGDGTEGTVLLRQTDGSGNSVNYRLTATQQGLVFSTMRSPSGSGSTTSEQEALRIDPDGTVRVKGGSVQSL